MHLIYVLYVTSCLLIFYYYKLLLLPAFAVWDDQTGRILEAWPGGSGDHSDRILEFTGLGGPGQTQTFLGLVTCMYMVPPTDTVPFLAVLRLLPACHLGSPFHHACYGFNVFVILMMMVCVGDVFAATTNTIRDVLCFSFLFFINYYADSPILLLAYLLTLMSVLQFLCIIILVVLLFFC